MNDAERVQVLDSCADLEGKVLNTSLRQLEASLLDVVEEVFAGHQFKDDEVVLTILENVLELDDVRVLTHLEHLDLSALLEYLNPFHVGLLDCLDGGLAAVELVVCELDEAKLPLAEDLAHLVVVEQVGVAQCTAEGAEPLLL